MENIHVEHALPTKSAHGRFDLFPAPLPSEGSETFHTSDPASEAARGGPDSKRSRPKQQP